MSERIAQRFKELQRKAVNGTSGKSGDQESAGHKSNESTSTVVFDDKTVVSEPESHKEAGKDVDKEKALPAIDKGKGKEVAHSDRKSTRLNSSHSGESRMPSSASSARRTLARS